MATHVRSRGVQTQPSAALRLKCTREFAKLKSRLELKLQNDLNSCFESSVYANFALITKTVAIPVHSAVLEARTPFFFKELISETNAVPTRISIPDIDAEQLRSLLRKVYTENFIEEEETILVALLRRARRLDKGDKVDNTTQPVTPTVISRLTTMEETLRNGNNPEDDDNNTINNNHNRNKNADQVEIEDGVEANCADDCCEHDQCTSGPSGPLTTTTTAESPTSSMMTSDMIAGITSDTDSGVVHRDSGDDTTATPKSERNENCEDDDDDDDDDDDEKSSHGLIRRDTFDLIDMVLAGDEDISTKDVDERPNSDCATANIGELVQVDGATESAVDTCQCDSDVDNAVRPRVVWEVGGTVLVGLGAAEAKKNAKNKLTEDENEKTDDNHVAIPFASCDSGVLDSLPEEEIVSPSLVELENALLTDKNPSEGFCQQSSLSEGKSREIADLEAIASKQYRELEREAIAPPLLMKRSSSNKLFSPDSIVSDRSPLLEKASILHQTVQVVPLLPVFAGCLPVDDGGIGILTQRRMSSRKSSDSLSPEADSLNIEPPVSQLIPMNIETVVEEELPPPPGFNDVVEEDEDGVPIISGFSDVVVEPPEEQKLSTPPPKVPGSFFVFIDMKEPPPPTNPPIGRRRRRAISFTSGDESLSVHHSGNLTVDFTQKDSLSEDENRPEGRLGTSPKTPTSVYMYIDAAVNSQHDRKSGSAHSRKISHQDGSLSSPKPRKSRHVRALSLGQEAMGTSTTPEPGRPRDVMRLQEMEILGKSSGSIQSADADDDVDTIYSEFSDYASQERSSCAISPEDEEGAQTLGPCSKLGEDLLRMFLEEINTDVVVRVNGKDIKAHKSVLSSRCSYFAAMLSGGWLESSGNIINMQGFSFLAVHFALCHIYSGATAIPKEADILEIASVADMLGLEGLKDVVALTLKAKYCHFFHKPCSACVNGVIECLPLCANYGLEELYEKSIRWLTRYMTRTWPTKAFASLPSELMNKCYLAAKADITVDTVLDTVMICDKLMATLPHVKWSEPVFGLASRLLESSTVFMAKNFHAVLTSKNFLALGKGQSWNVNALEETIMVALESLTPDSACLSYVTLSKLLDCGEKGLREEDPEMIENFVELLHKIQRQVERYLIHNANRVVHSPSWSKLSPGTQKRIKDAAVIVFEFGKPTAPPPRLSSLNRRFNRGKTHSPAEQSESSTTSSSSGKIMGPKRRGCAGATRVSKSSTVGGRPVTAPLSTAVDPNTKQDGPLQRKTTSDNVHGRTHAPKRSSMSNLDDESKDANKTSRGAKRHSDVASVAPQLRKTGSREVTSQPRPKSWPNKDRALHPVKTQNKENSKETTRLSNSLASLKGTAKVPSSNTATAPARLHSGSLSRAKSAVYSSEATPTELQMRPTRSATTSALRETKSSASKRVTTAETETLTKAKETKGSSRPPANFVRKSFGKDDCKLQSNVRRASERHGIKAGSGNKG